MHYFCTGGCGGSSESQAACTTEGCPMNGEQMVECHCADGSHAH